MIAKRFAAEGAAVVVMDTNIELTEKTVNEIKKKRGITLTLKAEVSRRGDVLALVKSALDNFKAVHILVNNAGIARNVPLMEVTEEDWDVVIIH